MKQLIVFDLDGTLAESKSDLDTEMSGLFHDLLGLVKVAVISGGDWPQFEAQLLSCLPKDERLAGLSILPTCGTKFYRYADSWTKVYSEDFTADEKARIIAALTEARDKAGLKAARLWGEAIEDRGSQITFSALGQHAPLAEKVKWDPDFAKRKKMKAILDSSLPGFSVRLGGTTSVDVTKPGIDKAYGIRKLRDLLGIPLRNMLFIGDALFPGGNDYPAEQAGVAAIPVKGPDETKRVIQTIIACLDAPAGDPRDEKEKVMRVDLDAKVQTHDGKNAGSVNRAVIDPRTNEVTDFVVGTGGLIGRDVLVPRGDLENATSNGDVLRLRLSKEDLEHMPAFDPTKYGEPPIGWEAPGLGYPFSGLLWPSSYLPAVSVPETVGSLSDEFTITKGTPVYDLQDEEIGVVDDVRIDPSSGQLTGLVIRAGGVLGTLFGRGQTVEIERAEIARVADRMVYLSESKEDLHNRFAKSELPR